MTFRKVLLLLLSSLLACYFIPSTIAANQSIGMISTLHLALNLALENHLVFGQDFVSTFGPLSFLLHRFPSGMPLLFYVLFDLLVVANIVYVIYAIISEAKLGISLRVGFVSILVFHGDVSFLLLLITIFLMFAYLKSRHYIFLVDIVLMTSISIMLRVDIGLVSFLFTVVFIVYLVGSQILDYKKSLLILLSQIVVVVYLAHQFNVNIFSYVYLGVSMINSYGESVQFGQATTMGLIDLVIGSACLFLLIVPLIFFFRRIVVDSQMLMLYGMLTVFGLFLFRSSFGGINDSAFFDYIVPLAGLLVFLTKIEQEKTFYYSLLPIILLTLLFTFRRENLANRFSTLARPDVAIMNCITAYQRLGEKSISTMDQPPPHLLNLISNETVDFIPGAGRFGFSNNLNYLPRPIPETQYVNTGSIDLMNANFIADKGSQFILVALDTASDRHFTFGEPKTKLEILRHYAIKESFDKWGYILLERLGEPLQLSTTTIADDRFLFGDSIELSFSEEIQIAYPEIEYSWLGKLFKFLFWAPDLELSLKLNDGSIQKFKYSKSLQSSGIVINKFVQPGDSEELKLFISYLGRLNTTVRSIHFSAESDWAFKDDFYVRIEKLEFNRSRIPIERRYAPLEFTKEEGATESSSVRANLEVFDIDSTRIFCFGWVFNEDSTQVNLKPSLLLQGKDHFLAYPLEHKIYRPDVNVVFGKIATDSAGFKLTFFKEFLSKSNYKVGLAYLDDNKIVKKIFLPGIEIINAKAPLLPTKEFNLSKGDKEGKITHNIDKIKITSKEFNISGWAFNADKANASFDSIKIILKSGKGKLFEGVVHGITRKDVSTYFNNNALDNTGFLGNFSTELLSKGLYSLGIYIRDGKTKLGTYQFIKEVSIGYPDEFSLTPFTNAMNLTKINDGINLEIERKEDSHDFFKISGWAYIPNRNCDDCEISILLESDDELVLSSATRSIQRPDVTAYFKNVFNLDNSGFDAVVSKKNLKRGRYKIGIHISCLGKRTQTATYFLDEYIEK